VQITLSVPYDAQLLRRTVKFLVRSQLRIVRMLGGVIAVCGLLLILLDPANVLAYAIAACGVGFLFVVGPLTVAFSMRAQSDAIRQGFHMTLDDDWVQVAYPLAESRFRWAALGRIVETPEVWYMMFGRMQAVTVPKSAMAPQQQTEFAAFVNRIRPAAGPARVTRDT
jgi:hypothetical protein